MPASKEAFSYLPETPFLFFLIILDCLVQVGFLHAELCALFKHLMDHWIMGIDRFISYSLEKYAFFLQKENPEACPFFYRKLFPYLFRYYKLPPAVAAYWLCIFSHLFLTFKNMPSSFIEKRSKSAFTMPSFCLNSLGITIWPRLSHCTR